MDCRTITVGGIDHTTVIPVCRILWSEISKVSADLYNFKYTMENGNTITGQCTAQERQGVIELLTKDMR